MIPSLNSTYFTYTAITYPNKNTARYINGINNAQINLKYKISIVVISTKKQSNEYDID